MIPRIISVYELFEFIDNRERFLSLLRTLMGYGLGLVQLPPIIILLDVILLLDMLPRL